LSIKGRIRAFQIVVALTLTGMAALALVNLRGSTHNLGRLQSAQRQLAAAAQLAIDANRFSEQIAELLLIGEPERPDFDSARAQLRQALDDLRQVTLEEDAVVGDREEEQVEVDRIDRMQALLGGIDRAVTALRGVAEVALRGAAKPQGVYREALSTVVARAAEIGRLVEDLLFLARSEADEIRFDMRHVDPMDLLAEAVRDAAALARERRVQVELSPQETPDPVLIRGDPRRSSRR